jgi:hypothetical protein
MFSTNRTTETLVILALTGASLLFALTLMLMAWIIVHGGLDMPYASLATALPAVPARALGVDVALLLRRAITRHALDAPTPATDAPFAGPITVLFDVDGTGFPHPYNGEWRDAYDRAQHAASTCGQACTYDTPAEMAIRHATAKHRDPTVDRVTIHRA